MNHGFNEQISLVPSIYVITEFEYISLNVLETYNFPIFFCLRTNAPYADRGEDDPRARKTRDGRNIDFLSIKLVNKLQWDARPNYLCQENK
jgi:hypothetical protein